MLDLSRYLQRPQNYIMPTHILLSVFGESCKSKPQTRKVPLSRVSSTNRLPEGNRFDSLPTSFFHNSLLSLLAVRQSGDGSSITCGNCKKKSCDVHYCFDCARFMCPDCLSAHEVMRAAFEGHKVMPVTEFQTAGRLRSLVEATTLLFRTIPRARDHKIFLSFLSILCLSRLYTHRPPKP